MIKTLDDIKREGIQLNTIYHGDCLKIMPYIKDKSIDLVLTDPPYGIGGDKGVGGDGKYPRRKYTDTWDESRPSKECFDKMLRVGRKIIIFGGNFFTDLLPVNGHWIVWDKSGDVNFRDTFSDAELAWTNINKQSVKKYTVIQRGFIMQEKPKLHPTQKPLRLFEAIIRDYSEKDNIVLDPFAGSGTTGVACANLGRNYILIERELKYCQIAEERIKNETRQQKLFDK